MNSANITVPVPEKEAYKRHRNNKRLVSRRYDKRKRIRKQHRKSLEVQKEVKNIKESNLVKNFSSENTIPDEVYLYLALGSKFCPTSTPKMHDYIFDAKAFCRKLAWSAYHENRRIEMEEDSRLNLDDTTEDEQEANSIFGWGCPKKLKIKSRQLPDYNDNLLSHVVEKIKDGIRDIVPPKKKKQNLTLLEARGQKWCKKAIKDKRLYITKADKGGGILILDANKVDQIMTTTLNETEKFEKLLKDPRDETKKMIKRWFKISRRRTC